MMMMMKVSSMCTQAVPPAGEDDDTAELLRLGLTAEQAARVLCTLGPMTQPLSTKLGWFTSQGLTDVTLFRMLTVSPELFRLNSNHLQAQLAALRATGLSPSQVAAMVNTAPLLLTSKVWSERIQAKIRFLTRDMGMGVQELVACPQFLICSLSGRIQPRWSFHSTHCGGQPFDLSLQLSPSDETFTGGLVSESLDAACAARSTTRAQLFEECKSKWQQAEGK